MSNVFSYSIYSALTKCGKFYDLRYLQRVPEPGPLSCHLAFGTSLHSALHAALTGEDSASVFEMYWGSYKSKDLAYDRDDWFKLNDIGMRFVENFGKRYAPKMKLIVAEERLSLPYEDIVLEGTPDAVVEYEGKNYLVDFKTTGYSYDKSKAVCSLQLNLYALMAERTKGIKIDGLMYLCFVKSSGAIQTPIVVPYDTDKAADMVADMHKDICAQKMLLTKRANSCIMGKYKCSYFETCWGKNESTKETNTGISD